MARYQQSAMKQTIPTRDTQWSPKDGSTALDRIDADYMPGFRYKITRNNYVVALYIGRENAIAAADERKTALPMDVWGVIDRQTGEVL